MPSYGEIKGYKASVENVKSLAAPEGKAEAVGTAASRKKKEKDASSVLPSVGKTTKAKPKESSKMEYIF
jgi:hypothetical protein